MFSPEAGPFRDDPHNEGPRWGLRALLGIGLFLGVQDPPGYSVSLPGRQQLERVSRLSHGKWFEPRSEPGLDCLMCAEFVCRIHSTADSRGTRRLVSRGALFSSVWCKSFNLPHGGVRRFRWGRIPGCYVTKFTQHKTLKLIASG